MAIHALPALRAAGPARVVVGLAGPPAAGKSTLAAALVARLNAAPEGPAAPATLLPMDGFHLDNAVLRARGLLARKGAPQTFDADGLLHLLRRARAPGGGVVHPVFDRARDLAVAGAGVIDPAVRVVVVEGNYLLLDRPPWRDLRALMDLTVMLRADPDVLRARLLARWRGHGLAPEAARRRAEDNDLPNARTEIADSAPADLEVAD
ncbi:nucleoside/nucleotide kinase family protein [Roseospira navarrensis]|uniref:Nucleoside/nucleotide kinase family protein n=2 Tax=Roseospira navarrensis TaxID=140058 RepID=A0A7X1ZDI9_9PROT|nr:nucleoside/nucleotide kinase family protein [Roseospira navarrensis]MQX36551.1 nucleoside/nucleotide kinase family protein [Roseospira navarrensis]